jgi:hypothetical protein
MELTKKFDLCLKEIQNGQYFAKTNDDRTSLLKQTDFAGAADTVTRSHHPRNGPGRGLLYGSQVNGFIKRLTPSGKDVFADVVSVVDVASLAESSVRVDSISGESSFNSNSSFRGSISSAGSSRRGRNCLGRYQTGGSAVGSLVGSWHSKAGSWDSGAHHSRASSWDSTVCHPEGIVSVAVAVEATALDSRESSPEPSEYHNRGSSSSSETSGRISRANSPLEAVTGLVGGLLMGETFSKDCCVITGKMGHKGYQGPDVGSCGLWWPINSLWTIGEVPELKVLINDINALQPESEERQKYEDRLRDALMKLYLGVPGSGKGVRSLPQNILLVPQHQDEFYDVFYNCVFVPILTAAEMENWNGETYRVAAFVGERYVSKDVVKQTHNHFQDGKTKHSAETAEKNLFQGMEPDSIQVCSTQDICIVTDVLIRFLKALADLHTRSLDDEGKITEKISPSLWGLIDWSKEVKKHADLAQQPGKPNTMKTSWEHSHQVSLT